MAGTGFTKRDLNRYRKVYPFIRRTPRQELYVAQSGVVIEIAEVSFSSSTEETYVYNETFGGTPIVTVSNKSTSTSVNLAITAISSTQVTIGASASWSGTAEVHIIYIP